MKKKRSALSQQEKLHRVKSQDITLTPRMTKELALLKKRKINLSDKESPEITEWKSAVVGKYYRPIKKQITVRIDADVLDWFKHAAEKYQTLINEACREYMIHHSRLMEKEKHA